MLERCHVGLAHGNGGTEDAGLFSFTILFGTLFEVLWCQMGLKHGQKVSCCCCLCIYGKGNEKQTIMHPAAAAFVY